MSARVLRRLRRLTDVLLIVGFVLAIALPLADVVVGLDPTPVLTEKRRLAPPPRLRPGEMVSVSYIGALESWWNDNFGFRRALVRQYSRVLLALGVSPPRASSSARRVGSSSPTTMRSPHTGRCTRSPPRSSRSGAGAWSGGTTGWPSAASASWSWWRRAKRPSIPSSCPTR